MCNTEFIQALAYLHRISIRNVYGTALFCWLKKILDPCSEQNFIFIAVLPFSLTVSVSFPFLSSDCDFRYSYFEIMLRDRLYVLLAAVSLSIRRALV